MTNTKRLHFASMGAPPIPVVPCKDFDRLPHLMLKDAWQLIGPSVDRNIEKIPIWQVIAAAYIEGMNHGYEFNNQKKDKVMEEAEREMPVYKCHKEVWALKIASIEERPSGVFMMTTAEKGFAEFYVDKEYMDKHKPHAGGYYVVYKDGYKSFSPAEAFEDGYSLSA